MPPTLANGKICYVEIHIMVDSVAVACEAVVANGGEIAQAIGADAPEITARFRDPSGNVMGLYQEPSRPASSLVTRAT
jgi:predicted enzyme related to lactoylglutathione lyase